MLNSTGDADFFIAKLNPGGNFLWAVKAGGYGTDQGRSIAVDSFGNSYSTGFYQDPPKNAETKPLSRSADNTFVVKFNTDGVMLWSMIAGSINEDRGYGIAVDQSFNSFITGSFVGTGYYDDIELVSNGSHDIFIAKLSPATSVVPVYRFFNNVHGGHLYTISDIERDSLMQIPEWTYEGIKFYVFPN